MKKFLLDVKEYWLAYLVWLISGTSVAVLLKFLVEKYFLIK